MLKLFNQCRSGASYRVRIALHLKDVPFEYVAVSLRGEQRTEQFLAVNPMGLVPVLQDGSATISQSWAILDWLEHRFPTPSLYPVNPVERAAAVEIASIIASEIQPLNNLRTKAFVAAMAQDRFDEFAWSSRWMSEGLSAVQQIVTRHGQDYCVSERPSIADLYLIPQMATAARMGFDLSAYPALVAIADRTREHPAFHAAAPERQPDWVDVAAGR